MPSWKGRKHWAQLKANYNQLIVEHHIEGVLCYLHKALCVPKLAVRIDYLLGGLKAVGAPRAMHCIQRHADGLNSARPQNNKKLVNDLNGKLISRRLHFSFGIHHGGGYNKIKMKFNKTTVGFQMRKATVRGNGREANKELRGMLIRRCWRCWIIFLTNVKKALHSLWIE